jgi:hypothetical protein
VKRPEYCTRNLGARNRDAAAAARFFSISALSHCRPHRRGNSTIAHCPRRDEAPTMPSKHWRGALRSVVPPLLPALVALLLSSRQSSQERGKPRTRAQRLRLPRSSPHRVARRGAHAFPFSKPTGCKVLNGVGCQIRRQAGLGAANS